MRKGYMVVALLGGEGWRVAPPIIYVPRRPGWRVTLGVIYAGIDQGGGSPTVTSHDPRPSPDVIYPPRARQGEGRCGPQDPPTAKKTAFRAVKKPRGGGPPGEAPNMPRWARVARYAPAHMDPSPNLTLRGRNLRRFRRRAEGTLCLIYPPRGPQGEGLRRNLPYFPGGRVEGRPSAGVIYASARGADPLPDPPLPTP